MKTSLTARAAALLSSLMVTLSVVTLIAGHALPEELAARRAQASVRV